MHKWANEKRFLERVKNHKLEVLQDDGVRRHLRFSNNGGSEDRFDLITWPWHLCYTGDMGSYLFSRVEDMFGFFTGRPNSGETIGINVGYWAEKVLAAERREGIQEFDENSFREAVREEWKSIVRDAIRSGNMDKAGSAELWESLEKEVLASASDGEIRARDAANEFECEVNGKIYKLEDFWEHDFQTYTGRFIWCCYAIAWGIKQYEATKCKLHRT